MTAGGMAVLRDRASAAVMFCTRKVVGWTWMDLRSWSWATALAIMAYGTFAFVCILPVFNTFWRAWRMQAVGGGTRGEPLVVSLLSCACSMLLTGKNNNWDLDKLLADESAWINGLGFLYLVFTSLLSESDTVQWMCTAAVVASWCIPLLLVLLVMEKDVGNLPDNLSSSIGLVYSIVWFARSWDPELDYQDPELDYHGLAQNFVGAICSIIFIVLSTLWTQHEAAAGLQGDLGQPLFDAGDIDIEEQQGGHQLEPQPFLPIVFDPEPVLPAVLDPQPLFDAGDIDIEEQQGGHQLEPQPFLPIVFDPEPVLPAVLDPQPVLPAADDPQPHVLPDDHNPPQQMLPVDDDPPQPVPPFAEPQQVLPVDDDPQPGLPVVEPPPIIPFAEPQQVPVDDNPQPDLPVVEPPPVLPFAEPQQEPVDDDPQPNLPIVEPPPVPPFAEPQQEPVDNDPQLELLVDPPPEPTDRQVPTRAHHSDGSSGGARN